MSASKRTAFLSLTQSGLRAMRSAVISLVALCAAPLAANAQQPAKVYRIAIVMFAPVPVVVTPISANPWGKAFIQGLNARGYIQGQNLVIDRWSRYGLDATGVEDMWAKLVLPKPDVIVVPGTGDALTAVKLTRGIPIVMAASVDPVGAGLAQSLARPGGIVTGLVTDVDTGAEQKRLDLFLQLIPAARRIAYVGLKGDWEYPWGKAIQNDAAKRRLNLFFAEGSTTGFSGALEAVRQRKSQAFFVALSPTTVAHGLTFGEFTLKQRIPSSCPLTEMADLGCLMVYGQSVADMGTRAVAYVDKILQGAKPADLPIEQPTHFQFVINMKTAKALGIKIPQQILLRADRVID